VPLVHPGYARGAGLHPVHALADFVRARDLTCRGPGAMFPASIATSTIRSLPPWAVPRTPANLKCYCRTHHLVKTFWGWREKQLVDGTLILTCASPGRYLCHDPGSALLFPSLCRAVGGMPAAEAGRLPRTTAPIAAS